MRGTLVCRLAFAAALASTPLFGTFHDVKIVQVFTGTSASPDAQYVLLQMWFPFQTEVGGHALTVYNADGSLNSTFTFPAPPGGNLDNGADQDYILFATAEAQTLFGMTADLTIAPIHPMGGGAKICWSGDGIDPLPPDCVAFGAYTGSASGVGAPFFLQDIEDLAVSRRLDRCGAATTLQDCDDTNNAATDFILTLPSPKNNARESGTLPSSTCGNDTLEGLEECDDGDSNDGDGCSSRCTIEPPAGGPQALSVDPSASDSDGNGILEPGEAVIVRPSWKNTGASAILLHGGATNFTGPAGPTYSIRVGLANYATIDPGGVHECTASGFCYQLALSDPVSRPMAHWDAAFDERMTGNFRKTWTLHVGDSFTDVPRSQPFYKKIETLFHTGITTGCTATTYCPASPVSRSQMAIFLGRGIAGGGAAVPVSGTVGAQPYNCVAGGTSVFSDVPPTDIACKSIHYIAAQNVTLGCGTGTYCPAGNVTRLEMASFIAKAVVAPGGGAAIPTTYGPDPVTGFSYSCNAGSPNVHFVDVPATDVFCKHVHFLWAKGIIAGCTGTQYCPTQNVTRDAMAKFLSNAFNLLLYGP